MIISHKYKFIFVKTLKTGGTSVEVALADLCGPEDVVTPIHSPVASAHLPRNYKGVFNPLREYRMRRENQNIPESGEIKAYDQTKLGLRDTFRQLMKRNKFYNHMPAYRIQSRVPDHIWNGYYKFCVERNPWDKTVSYYYWLSHKYANGKMSFEDFLKRDDHCLNYHYYMDMPGEKMLVDRVIRYENMEVEINEVLEVLNVDGRIDLSRHREKGSQRKTGAHYREVIKGEHINMIGDIFKKEIDLFGYQY